MKHALISLFVMAASIGFSAGSSADDLRDIETVLRSRVCPRELTRLWPVKMSECDGLGMVQMAQCQSEVDRINRRIDTYNAFISECNTLRNKAAQGKPGRSVPMRASPTTVSLSAGPNRPIDDASGPKSSVMQVPPIVAGQDELDRLSMDLDWRNKGPTAEQQLEAVQKKGEADAERHMANKEKVRKQLELEEIKARDDAAEQARLEALHKKAQQMHSYPVDTSYPPPSGNADAQAAEVVNTLMGIVNGYHGGGGSAAGGGGQVGRPSPRPPSVYQGGSGKKCYGPQACATR